MKILNMLRSYVFYILMILIGVPFFKIAADSPNLYSQNKNNTVRNQGVNSNTTRPNNFYQTDQNYYYNHNSNLNKKYVPQKQQDPGYYNNKSVKNIYEPR
jgi:hypothetical protein